MILCCGEALIDMIPTPTVSGVDGFVPHTGGAVFNTAIALGRLGAGAGLLTGLSQDTFGQQLLGDLQASNVDTSNIITSKRPSTLAFVTLKDGNATYDFFDDTSAGRMLTPQDMSALKGDVSALFMGGISLCSEPCGDAYASLLEREGATRAVMLDPNIRPSLFSDIARYRARLGRMIAQSDIVKVSEEDLEWIEPDAGPLRAKIDALLAKGPSVVILTRGGDGATGYLRGGGEVEAPALSVEVVDTVGAGDSFNAGVLAKLSEDGHLTKAHLSALPLSALEAAMGYGARVAAVTVSRAGANPPWTKEL